MGEGALDLAQQVRGELARPAPDAAVRLSAAIRERLGDATAAVVFYGSCLRKDTDEGVLVTHFDLDEIARYRAEWGFFRDRRTDLYGKINL